MLGAHAVHRRVARDAGIVDQDFDRPERRLDRLHAVRASGEIADVEFEDRKAGIVLELLRGLVVATVDRGDAIAGILERHRDRAADTARPTGDHRYPGHPLLPSL